MEIRTGTLEKRQLEEEIEYLTAFFSARGFEQVLIAYGWGSRLTLDEMWMYEPVQVNALADHIRESRNAGRFYPGESDLLIADPGQVFRFVLCHESDIHFEGEPEVALKVLEHWRNKGFSVQVL